ncbi:hypothetical protein [Arcobacter sp. L]|uniref:hypothetical protein n=1 Tax=Arcobacter sp. L TaxID=944547 RepID=UPI0002295EDF|nr:hypothetical protein [Arcobacter sp. L]BAK72793.1 hypothetical protein ABLL_0918 [Arcobacter sp. L]
MLINCPTNIKTIFDLDYIFNDNEILKDFIIEIIEVCEKINEETQSKHSVIFWKKVKYEYLYVDYKILIISLLNFLQKIDISVENFENIKREFAYNDYEKLNNAMCNLLFILGKKEIVYFSNIKKYYIAYEICINHGNINYITKMNSISLKYSKILQLFSNNKKMIAEFEKYIKRDFEFVNKKTKLRNKSYYRIEQFSQFRDYFMSEF